jgi:hypothetical protein
MTQYVIPRDEDNWSPANCNVKSMVLDDMVANNGFMLAWWQSNSHQAYNIMNKCDSKYVGTIEILA